jgi:2-amino-4-hydroxy-6-hydroxymethyldihydropteridine diphosphokinase
VFLSLGTNLGDRISNLRRGVEGLRGQLLGIRVSSIYETEPMYVSEQPRFLNIAVAGTTSLTAGQLLHRCQEIERQMGRDRSRRQPKGPRVIDLDILLFGGEIIQTPELEIPHPLMNERRFVLVPLLELEPELRDPKTGNRYAESLAKLDREREEQGVYIFSPWAYTGEAPDRP